MVGVVLNYLRNHRTALLVVLLILADLLANYYFEKEAILLEERCSSEFSDVANVLDKYVTLTDGSIQESDGDIYPIGSYWNDGRVIWGCPCRIRRCVSKCCPIGQAFDSEYRCVDVDEPYRFTDLLEVFHDDGETLCRINMTHNSFSIIINKCNDSEIFQNAEDFSLLENGRVWDTDEETELDHSEYCIEQNNSEKFINHDSLLIALCLPTEEENRIENNNYFWYWTVLFIIATLTVVTNLVAFLVFAVLPQLRRGYGRSIMCYLLSRGICGLIVEISETDYIKELTFLCKILYPLQCFFGLSARTWQIDVSVDIWLLFKNKTVSVCKTKNSEGLKRFLVHSALAWGIPMALVAVPLAGHLIPGSPEYLQPQWDSTCSWSNQTLLWICIIIPDYLGVLTTTVMYGFTLRLLQASKKTSKTLQRGDSQIHNSKYIEWSSLYVKVCLLMGVIFIFSDIVYLIIWITETPRYVLDTWVDIEYTRGVEVFLIFVCKREVLKSLAQKLFGYKNTII